MSTEKNDQPIKLGFAKPSAGIRVLIVGDTEPLRGPMADVLKLEGYTVTEAIGASNLRSCMRTGRDEERDSSYDLIVADIKIPGENGLVGLEKLRRGGCRTPAVVVTAFPGSATTARARELLATVLPKPFTLEELRTVAATALKRYCHTIGDR